MAKPYPYPLSYCYSIIMFYLYDIQLITNNNNTIMKQSSRFLFVLPLLFLVVLSSCTSSDNISSSTIVKQFNKEIQKRALDKQVSTIKIGTYECNDADERLSLRKMAAAGLITYQVDRYPWWEKSKATVRKAYEVEKYSYWYGYYTDTEYRTVLTDKYEFEDHYIVTIGLTNKGLKYVLSEYPKPEVTEDPDLKEPEIDASKYAWNKADLKEEWSEIKNPFITEQPVKESAKTKPSTSSDSDDIDGEESSIDDEESDNKVERINAGTYSNYKARQLSSTDAIVLLGTVKAIKARNIQLVEQSGIKKAVSEIILSRCDVTDFGRILDEIENGEKSAINASLKYYLDKGWVIASFDDDDDDD